MKIEEIENKREKTAEQRYKEWREEYSKLAIMIKSEPLISIKDAKTYLFKKRLARLVLIVVGIQKKCFLNNIYESVNKIFEIRSYTDDYLRCANKLSLYGLISIHRLSLIPNKELIERYKTLKTKCSAKKINYYKFINNNKNMDILNWATNLEFKKK